MEEMADYITEHWNNTFKSLRESSTERPVVGKNEENTSSYEENLVVSIILSIFSVVGTLGNGLVLYVFTRTTGKLTSTVFIIALAATDFVTCLVTIPFTVVAINTEYFMPYDMLCKLYQFLITCPVPLSAFIMVAIAVDRYICICHPFAHIMTVKKAKVIVGILAAFACVLGLITSLGFSLYKMKEVSQNTTVKMLDNITVGYSNTTGRSYSIVEDVRRNVYEVPKEPKYEKIFSGQCEDSTVLLSRKFTDVYQKIYSAFFLLSLLIVFILYGLIYSSVVNQRAKRRAQKLGSRVKQVNSQCQTDETTIPLNNVSQSKVTSSHHNAHLRVEMDGQTACTRLTDNQENGVSDSLKKSIKKPSYKRVPQSDNGRERRDHDRLANIKTAGMLFIVTIVFIIAFLPAWLMAHRWLDFSQIVFYMYFIYNVANPVIYAFMNQMFRENMCKIFTSCRGHCIG